MHRLPDGTETISSEEYVEAWRKLAEPLEKMLDLNHISFDPHVNFYDSEGRILMLPVWFLESLNAHIKKVHAELEQANNLIKASEGLIDYLMPFVPKEKRLQKGEKK